MSYAFEQEDGTVAICNLLSSVPSGANYVENPTFPEDKLFRNAYRIVNGELVTSLPEAKLIVHEKRRADRAVLFAPLDILSTIPAKANQAEAGRQVIRDADDAKQIAIDNAVDEAGLREVM
tara:strand:- start:93 stop:455 length:363 start_codon:yes stop_codon:yes gene_type:complete